MRHLSLAVLALALVSAPIVAQTTPITPPKVAPCDPSAILLTAEPIYGVGAKSIVAACPAFADRIATYYAAHPALTASELVSELLHGTLPKPPADTVIPPPVVTPPPVVVPPKDSTPTPPPPRDTAVVIPPAGALVNAHPMGPLTQPFVAVPKGWAGRNVADLKPGGGTGVPENRHGSFRMLCGYAYMAFDDPVVLPGQPGASHLHQFFGNTNVNAFTTSDSIATTGNSTCSGGTLNRTGYWTPAAIDSSGNVLTPTVATVYYKSSLGIDPATVQPMPVGLKVVAGDKTWSNAAKNQEHVWWTCTDRGPAFSAVIPDCGDRVELIVIFPSCWDPTRLDSPDHKSHLAYPTFINSSSGGSASCPKTHPTVLPEVTEEFYWKVPTGVQSSTWHLSSDMDVTKPGGLSAHADYEMGWPRGPGVYAAMDTLVKLCINASKDCGVNGIGNSHYLNPPPL